jgi:tRNA pseudouridine55 synthase
MARRKKGNPVNGWLILDKPVGMTSTQAVGFARRMFNAQKAGHAGTLDPLATGVLPIAMGEATKTVPYAVDGEKHYRFTVRWGAETNTDDSEGETVETSALRPSRADILSVIPRFIGEVSQVPPAFSAIKIDGNRAYDLARAGEEVVLEPRIVVIDSLELVEMVDDVTAVFEARCGKGTYVRAIARDMGRLLGCRGHIIALRRTQVGGFHEGDAVSVEELEAASQAGWDQLETLLSPIETALRDLTELSISQNDAVRLLRGQSVLIRGRDAPHSSGPSYATCKGNLIAVGEIEKGELRPIRVFNFGG